MTALPTSSDNTEPTGKVECDCQPGYPGAPRMDHLLSCPLGTAETDRSRFEEWVGPVDDDTGAVNFSLGYPNVHAAALDWCFPVGESYDDEWLNRVFELWAFVIAAPCACTPEMVEDFQRCPRCDLLNEDGRGR